MKNILNIFKTKKHKKVVKPKKEIYEQAWDYEDVKPQLQELYDCSVQKTVKDFQIRTVDVAGNGVCVAMDSLSDDKDFDEVTETINRVFQMQAMGQEIIFTYYAKQGFIGFSNCAILAQDWLIHKAITAPCEDAISVPYDVTLNKKDETEQTQDDLTKLKELSDNKEKFNIKEICNIFAQNKRKYGQALCVPLVDGVDYTVPFNIDAVQPDSYRGMSVVEPVWITPVLDTEAMTDPMSKRFYQPTWFRMPNGQLVHYTWCIFNTYGVPSDILKPTYYFGGIPLPQLLYEQVYAAHKTAKEAPMLAQTKRLNYVEGNPNALLFDPDREKKFSFISWVRNNFGFLLIKPEQRIGQFDTSLSDFDSVVMLCYQLVAAISGVIATRLLETSPKGWQSSGSYEDNQYKKLQQNIQYNDFMPILDMHYQLLAKSKYGISAHYQITFDEIDTPTAKEAAEIREINSRTAATYINAGVISAEEERTKLREDETSGYNALEAEMPESEENDPFNDLEGNESLGELIDDPNVTPSEAATLNGVQVTSMVNVASQVAKGELSRESAIAILQKSFNMSEQEAAAIIGSEKLPDDGGSETSQDPFQ